MNRFALCLIFVLGTASLSCAATTSAVTWTGAAAKGGYSTNTTFASLETPAINASGAIAFSGSVREIISAPFVMALQGSAPVAAASSPGFLPPTPAPGPSPILPKITNTWSGLWIMDSRGSTTLVARIGSPFGLVDAGGFGSLGAPLLNNSNLCAYAGNYYPGFIAPPPILIGAPVTNFFSGSGIWTSASPYSPVAFVGQTAPGYAIPFTTPVGTLNSLAGLVSSNGTITTNQPVTFTNLPSFVSIDGLALPDSGRLVFSATVSTANYYFPARPTNPVVAMPTYVATQPLLQRGVWGQDPQGRLVTIAREGEPLMFGKSNRIIATLAPENLALRGTNLPLFCAGSMNASGEIALNAAFTDGNQAIIVASARSNSLSIASMTGDSAPGGANKDFFLSFGSPSINSAGHVAFLGTAGFVTQFPIVYSASPSIGVLPSNPIVPAPSYTNSWSGLWAEDSSGNVRLITRFAPPVPDMGGFTSLSNPLINSRHQIAFQGTYRQGFIRLPAGSFGGGSGVWTTANLSNPVAWIGQTAPGYPTNFTISVKSPYGWSTNMISLRSAPPILASIERIAFPDTGRLVVWGTASATNWVPRPPVPKGMVVTQEIRSSILNQRGIWIQNAQGKLDLALREGMSVSVNGASKVISSLPLPSPTTPASGQETLCSRSNGIVVTTATFTDGTQAILRITP